MGDRTASYLEELIGRSNECSEISKLLNQARGGETVVATLQGPAGSGKTALLEWVLNESQQDEWRTIFVRSHRAASQEPYYLLNSITDQCGDDETANDDRARAQSTEPELRDIHFAVSVDLLSRIRKVTTESPTLLIIDDAQWADIGSLNALEFLAGQLHSKPLLVLLGIRTGPGQIARPELVALLRHAEGRIINVNPLGLEDVQKLLNLQSNRNIDQDQVKSILGLSGGLPLLVKLLGKAPPDASLDGVSGDALRVVLSYLSTLPQDCKDALRLIAAFGRPIRMDDLRQISGLEQAKLAGLVDLAVLENVIVFAPSGDLWFSHPLMPESLLSELPSLKLAEFHAAITDHLVQQIAEDSGKVIAAARHASLASGIVERRRLVDLTILATEECLRRGDWKNAAEQLSVLDRVELTELDESQRAGVQFARARILSADGLNTSTRRAWPMLMEAFELFLSLGEIDAAIEVAIYPNAIAGIPDAEKLTARALELTEPGSIFEGWVLARRGIALADTGRDAEALASHQSALDIARKHGFKDLETRTMVHLSQAHYRSFRPDKCIKIGRAAINHALATNDLLSVSKATPFLFLSLLTLGKIDEAQRLIDSEKRWLESYPHPQLIVSVGIQKQMIARVTADHQTALEYRDEDYLLELAKSYAGAAMFSECDSIMNELWLALVVGGGDVSSQWQLIDAVTHRILLEPLDDWHLDSFDWLEAMQPLFARLKSNRNMTQSDEFGFSIVDAALALAFPPKASSLNTIIESLRRFDNVFHPEIEVCVRRVEGRLHWKSGDLEKAAICFNEAIQFANDAGLAAEHGRAQNDLVAVAVTKRTGSSYPWTLTAREWEVAQLVASGLTNRAIGAKLHLSHHTVGHHVRNALSKTGLPNRAALAAKISSLA